MKKILYARIGFIISVIIILTGCSETLTNSQNFSLDSVPAFSGKPYVTLNNNQPYFTSDEIKSTSFEKYSPLDHLGRSGVALSCLGTALMPSEERGAIGNIKPSGWHTVKYDIVDGKYLYNRCHLIGYQLSGENANIKNLITGTRYMNINGMLPFENMVADYIKESNNHVMYRVNPIYNGNNLVASGITMEAYSVEDSGEGICFNVYVYNVQPGIYIDYATGDSSLLENENDTDSRNTSEYAASSNITDNQTIDISENNTYIVNKNTKKFHLPSCSGAKNIKASNIQEYTGSRDNLILQGYSACKSCNP